MIARNFVLPILWLAWIAYWLISARGAKETERTETEASRFGYMLLLVVGAILMAVPSLPWGVLGGRFVDNSTATATAANPAYAPQRSALKPVR